MVWPRDFSPQRKLSDRRRACPYIRDMSDTQNPSEIARAAIFDAAMKHIPFEGWTTKSLRMAASDAGLPEGAEELYFPGGPLELIRYWSEKLDADTAARMASLDLDNMRIRDKVTQGVLARLEAIGPHEEAARRALSRLTLPDAVAQAASQVWASADTIWRGIGDTSTDANYYSKRTILSGVIGSSMLSWLSDTDRDKAKARAFLDARIQNVMQFEKAKWQFKSKTADMPKPAEILGRLRYSSRRRRRRAR